MDFQLEKLFEFTTATTGTLFILLIDIFNKFSDCLFFADDVVILSEQKTGPINDAKAT